MRREERGSWYLLTGLVIGAVLGLLYARSFQPVIYRDTTPASLDASDKDRYRALIAAAYMADGDLVRARARLEELGDADPYQALAEQAQRTLAEGNTPQEARALGLLAVALGQAVPTLPGSPEQTVETGQGGVSSGTFTLQSRQLLCDRDLGEPVIQVLVFDANGQPLSNVEVAVSWENGEEHFFTGLKPELGPGYADFSMSPGITYSLFLVEGGEPVSDLEATQCETGGEPAWGVWQLEFTQR